ncbi:hypothetical protein ACWDG1_50310, partial [Streptomyces sp. NPDC001177]
QPQPARRRCRRAVSASPMIGPYSTRVGQQLVRVAGGEVCGPGRLQRVLNGPIIGDALTARRQRRRAG